MACLTAIAMLLGFTLAIWPPLIRVKIQPETELKEIKDNSNDEDIILKETQADSEKILNNKIN